MCVCVYTRDKTSPVSRAWNNINIFHTLVTSDPGVYLEKVTPCINYIISLHND